ncbi:17053_t:CDS:2 [Racocetra fulgida]|uniref:17053_t:CDS:1 n=1 Tax=Racocetra fulgida TaxID=60492 RepID=A0A9N8ZT56_9GLOM|nr:17053_t:CDS:2 [Racocetra fulgida]
MDSNTQSTQNILREHKNQIKRERYARRMSRAEETPENSEQIDLQKKKQNEAKHHVTNTAQEKVAGSKRAPIFSICCAKGKMQLSAIETPPTVLRTLLIDETTQAQDFFAGTQGIYKFHIQRELYYRIGSIMPENRNIPFCSQIYIFDTNAQLQRRHQLMPNLDLTILAQLHTMLYEVNPYMHSFQNAALILNENLSQELRIISIINEDSDNANEFEIDSTNDNASNDIAQREFADWLLLIGEGRIAEVTPHSSYIKLPPSIVLHDESSQKLIDFVYPALHIRAHDPTYIVERSILAPLNSDVDMLNTEILLQFSGEAKIYYSANSLDQSSPMYNSAHEDIYSTEFLNLLAIIL